MTKPIRVFHKLQQANSALFRAVDGLLKAQVGIVSAHQVILFVLAQEDGLPSAKVASRAGMRPSRLTSLLDTLETKRLVRREQSPHDGRVQRIFITSDGAAVIQSTASLARDLNADLLAPFDPEQRRTIAAFLDHVAAMAETITNR